MKPTWAPDHFGAPAFGLTLALALALALAVAVLPVLRTITAGVESAPAATCPCNVGSACSPGCDFFCSCTTSWGCGCGWVWTCNGTYCA
ncbi:hypothetical protein ACH4F6_00010 [Streptomyces sp. NPDC017936]|uniref:hypothetical protein n=1 Tax=Streptomyces sp. NPDC017936 TaxID=3365016 RepID=UPI0037AE9DDD